MTTLTLDVFNQDAFSNNTLTTWVNENVQFVPGLLGGMGIFTGSGVYTTNVQFDEEAGALTLIESSPRGSAPSQSVNTKAKTRIVPTVHLAREAALYADQVAGVRVPGQADVLQTAERLVQKRIEGPTGLKATLGYTLEHLYMGAINGNVIDADGSTVLWNYFTIYGVDQPAATNFDFSTSTSDGAQFSLISTGLRRSMVKALNGLSLDGAAPVALCSDGYYDAVWGCKEVVAARKTVGTGNMQAIDYLSNNKAYDSFRYAGINFVNYRGSDDGAVKIPDNEARLFLSGVPGLFQTFFAPADTWDFVNTEGLPSYLIQRRERQTESSRVFEIQSNPLAMCMRPLHLQRLTKP